MSAKYVFASTWSERHAAYAAGLGTFGLCDGLITPGARLCGPDPWWPGLKFRRHPGPTPVTGPIVSSIPMAVAENVISF